MERILYINTLVHPDINEIIKQLTLYTFPRPKKCMIYKIDDDSLCNYVKLNRKKFIDILDYMISKNAKMIYGDLISVYHNGRGRKNDYTVNYFYNGNRLIEIDNTDNNYLLFKVLINNVPIDYWSEVYNGIYVDIDQHVNECINNITFGLVTETLYGVYTFFNHQDKTYRIIFNFSKCNSNKYQKYLYTNKRKWENIACLFRASLHGHIQFYVPPAELNDGLTIILNNNIDEMTINKKFHAATNII